MTAATQEVASGKLGHQVPVRSKDELGTLTESFNRGSAELARSTVLRRKMTADIAHDLRTPLSIILGYTKALQDQKLAPDPEMFAVMYKEAQHLNHLIDDLKTLALADAGELPLTISYFPLAICSSRSRMLTGSLPIGRGSSYSLSLPRIYPS